ncbi:MAG: ABC transporter substrate-binding protein [Bacteroidales bacterium]|nr:ABC transporter substrate-binding protein [Bacteroidales bacterium]
MRFHQNIIITISILVLLSCQESTKPSPKAQNKKAIKTIQPSYAKWFNIEYFDGFKKINIISPWTHKPYQSYYVYINDKPELHENEQACAQKHTPSCYVLSGTILGFFKTLNLNDIIGGIDQKQYSAQIEIRQKVEQNKILEVGDGERLNLERVLIEHPDMVFTSGWPQIHINNQRLIQQGIPVVFTLDWQESSALARAEWIKFIAAFFEQDKLADSLFKQVEKRYIALSNLAKAEAIQPTVMHGTPMSGVWYMAGGKSYMAKMYQDAGAQFLWANDSSTGSLPLDFEAVFLKAEKADYWFCTSPTDEFLKDDKLQLFDAVKNGQVYSNSVPQSGDLPNLYWEIGTVRPDWILEDLIHILHPSILPTDSLHFYRKFEN